MPRNERGSSQPVTKMEPGAADRLMRSRSRLIHLDAPLLDLAAMVSAFCPCFVRDPPRISAKAVSASARDYGYLAVLSSGESPPITLITQRSLVQIQPPQPLTTRGERPQEPLTPFVYQGFT